MDPRTNPYAPGAGSQPPELAGRDEILEKAATALDRIKAGKQARSLVLHGLRGVGKTVLLNKIRREAEARDIQSVVIEAPEHRSLPGILVPALRAVLIRLDRVEATKAIFGKAKKALAGLAKAAKVKYEDVEFGLDFEVEDGLADSGDLEHDLGELFMAVGEAAKARNTAIVLYIDEVQYVPEEQLAALISALHRAAQEMLPVTMLAAGLPQILGQMGKAKSYAERLFEFTEIDSLGAESAKKALCKPAEAEKVTFEQGAIDEILEQTKGYPYFLQEWGKHSWNIAASSPITAANAREATKSAIAELDASFFSVRLDRLAPAEKLYLRAMAELGPGPHRSGDIAASLGKPVNLVAPTRNSLIAKGMVFSKAHGDTAFTVPLFDGFMKRAMVFKPEDGHKRKRAAEPKPPGM